MRKIETDEDLLSLHAQAVGYIYNDYSGITPSGAVGNVLHLAQCAHVARSNTNYGKFYFEDYSSAAQWLSANRGRETVAWRRCRVCLSTEG